ncbi:hypothetical protein KHS38_11765 [Mucilaginibacter sp. Bleaf8]|uniref:hypothetical protein n=1 Tax=Mucilaginibacter sp. Bleaf8 TaxID=2834430 RepID=UPI001BCDA48D|nr:hypothetical protein [Mucilaginibacter sp. Bleaf8]MBS7565082.1 hypothetical protein [Mucilaginibacter sp. Bleaf8]
MSTLIKYNNEGLPVSGYIKGSPLVMSASSFGAPADQPKQPAGHVAPNVVEARAATRWVPWGPTNNYPVEAAADFRLNGIASRGLKLKGDMLYGKRVVACKVKGFDDGAQKEVVEIVSDPEINQFLTRSNINAFRSRAITDFVWLSMIFPIFLLNPDRSKISMVVHDKASKFRFAPFDEQKGRIDKVFRSANWPNPSEGQYEELAAIDSYLYALEVDRIRYDNQYKYVYPIQSYDILNDYYAVTIQEALRKNGTLANSNSIPAIVKSMIKNVMSIKYHIRIPLSYWETLYPNFKKLSDKERDKIVGDKLQEINDFLSGQDNQMKAFISHYTVDRITGKETGWEIVPLDDKMKYDSWTGVDTAAAAQILFAIGINPAIFGLDSPSGGMGNNGGSNIREAWLTLIASSQGERDTIYSWWPFVREYNGYDPDIELRTIDQVLTTLDQGKGTSKTVS